MICGLVINLSQFPSFPLDFSQIKITFPIWLYGHNVEETEFDSRARWNFLIIYLGGGIFYSYLNRHTVELY